MQYWIFHLLFSFEMWKITQMKAGDLDYILYRHNLDAVAAFGYMRIILSFILYIFLISTQYYCFTFSWAIFECDLILFIFTNVITVFVFSKLSVLSCLYSAGVHLSRGQWGPILQPSWYKSGATLKRNKFVASKKCLLLCYCLIIKKHKSVH